MKSSADGTCSAHEATPRFALPLRTLRSSDTMFVSRTNITRTLPATPRRWSSAPRTRCPRLLPARRAGRVLGGVRRRVPRGTTSLGTSRASQPAVWGVRASSQMPVLHRTELRGVDGVRRVPHSREVWVRLPATCLGSRSERRKRASRCGAQEPSSRLWIRRPTSCAIQAVEALVAQRFPPTCARVLSPG